MDQFSTKGKSVLTLVLMMSMPSVLSMLVNSLYNIVDSYFVAKISENAMAALALVFPMQNLLTSLGVGFGVGINAMIAKNLGSKNQEAADRATSFGVLLSILHGILFTVMCISIMPWFLGMFTDDSAIISLGLKYSKIVFSFAIAVTVGIALEKIFQSVGRMKTSMFALMAGCITNIILDPIFIFGFGPIQAMGIQGAALATIIGQIVTILTYIIMMLKKPLPVKLSIASLKGGHAVGDLYLVGIPATLNMALPSLLISALNSILAIYSPVYIIILGIYYKLQSFVYLPANGVIQGIRPLISYNYGAQNYEGVKQIYKVALSFIFTFMTIGTLLCVFLPTELMELFTSNEETIAQGSIALRLISIGFIPSSLSIISCGALEALGKGMSSLVTSLLRYVVVIIPLAYLFSHMWKAKGVWIAFAVTECIACVVSFLLYKKQFRFSNHDSK